MGLFQSNTRLSIFACHLLNVFLCGFVVRVSHSSHGYQLQEEIKIMSQLEHKHILRLEAYEWDTVYPHKNGSTLGIVAMVLELAKGGTLVDCLMETGAFSEGASQF